METTDDNELDSVRNGVPADKTNETAEESVGACNALEKKSDDTGKESPPISDLTPKYKEIQAKKTLEDKEVPRISSLTPEENVVPVISNSTSDEDFAIADGIMENEQTEDNGEYDINKADEWMSSESDATENKGQNEKMSKESDMTEINEMISDEMPIGSVIIEEEKECFENSCEISTSQQLKENSRVNKVHEKSNGYEGYLDKGENEATGSDVEMEKEEQEKVKETEISIRQEVALNDIESNYMETEEDNDDLDRYSSLHEADDVLKETTAVGCLNDNEVTGSASLINEKQLDAAHDVIRLGSIDEKVTVSETDLIEKSGTIGNQSERKSKKRRGPKFTVKKVHKKQKIAEVVIDSSVMSTGIEEEKQDSISGEISEDEKEKSKENSEHTLSKIVSPKEPKGKSLVGKPKQIQKNNSESKKKMTVLKGKHQKITKIKTSNTVEGIPKENLSKVDNLSPTKKKVGRPPGLKKKTVAYQKSKSNNDNSATSPTKKKVGRPPVLNKTAVAYQKSKIIIDKSEKSSTKKKVGRPHVLKKTAVGYQKSEINIDKSEKSATKKKVGRPPGLKKIPVVHQKSELNIDKSEKIPTKKKVGRPLGLKKLTVVHQKKVGRPPVLNKTTVAYHKSEINIDKSEKRPTKKKVGRPLIRGEFKCAKCNYFTTLKKNYEIHKRKCRPPLKCRFCDFTTRTMQSFMEHEANKHTREKPFKCDKCDYASRYKADLYHHRAKHREEKLHKCPHCDFVTKWRLYHHLLKHTEARPYKCDICGFSFKRIQDLKYHMYRHNDNKPIACDQCEFRCKTNYELKCHKLKHSDERKFACSHPGCSQRVKTKSDLTKHMKVHIKEKTHVCEKCGKGFKTMACLNKHRNRHTDVRPFSCDICQRKFKVKSSLRKHIYLHTGVKPFVCEVCGHRFSSKSNMKVHLKTHEVEDRPFRCPICPHGSRTKGHLLAHIGSMHGRSFAYFCELCKKPFKRYHQLEVHYKRMHKLHDFESLPDLKYEVKQEPEGIDVKDETDEMELAGNVTAEVDENEFNRILNEEDDSSTDEYENSEDSNKTWPLNSSHVANVSESEDFLEQDLSNSSADSYKIIENKDEVEVTMDNIRDLELNEKSGVNKVDEKSNGFTEEGDLEKNEDENEKPGCDLAMDKGKEEQEKAKEIEISVSDVDIPNGTISLDMQKEEQEEKAKGVEISVSEVDIPNGTISHDMQKEEQEEKAKGVEISVSEVDMPNGTISHDMQKEEQEEKAKGIEISVSDVDIPNGTISHDMQKEQQEEKAKGVEISVSDVDMRNDTISHDMQKEEQEEKAKGIEISVSDVDMPNGLASHDIQKPNGNDETLTRDEVICSKNVTSGEGGTNANQTIQTFKEGHRNTDNPADVVQAQHGVTKSDIYQQPYSSAFQHAPATLAMYDGFRLPLATKGFEFNLEKTGKKPRSWFMDPKNICNKGFREHQVQYLVQKEQLRREKEMEEKEIYVPQKRRRGRPPKIAKPLVNLRTIQTGVKTEKMLQETKVDTDLHLRECSVNLEKLDTSWLSSSAAETCETKIEMVEDDSLPKYEDRERNLFESFSLALGLTPKAGTVDVTQNMNERVSQSSSDYQSSVVPGTVFMVTPKAKTVKVAQKMKDGANLSKSGPKSSVKSKSANGIRKTNKKAKTKETKIIKKIKAIEVKKKSSVGNKMKAKYKKPTAGVKKLSVKISFKSSAAPKASRKGLKQKKVKAVKPTKSVIKKSQQTKKTGPNKAKTKISKTMTTSKIKIKSSNVKKNQVKGSKKTAKLKQAKVPKKAKANKEQKRKLFTSDENILDMECIKIEVNDEYDEPGAFWSSSNRHIGTSIDGEVSCVPAMSDFGQSVSDDDFLAVSTTTDFGQSVSDDDFPAVATTTHFGQSVYDDFECSSNIRKSVQYAVVGPKVQSNSKTKKQKSVIKQRVQGSTDKINKNNNKNKRNIEQTMSDCGRSVLDDNFGGLDETQKSIENVVGPKSKAKKQKTVHNPRFKGSTGECEIKKRNKKKNIEKDAFGSSSNDHIDSIIDMVASSSNDHIDSIIDMVASSSNNHIDSVIDMVASGVQTMSNFGQSVSDTDFKRAKKTQNSYNYIMVGPNVQSKSKTKKQKPIYKPRFQGSIDKPKSFLEKHKLGKGLKTPISKTKTEIKGNTSVARESNSTNTKTQKLIPLSKWLNEHPEQESVGKKSKSKKQPNISPNKTKKKKKPGNEFVIEWNTQADTEEHVDMEILVTGDQGQSVLNRPGSEKPSTPVCTVQGHLATDPFISQGQSEIVSGQKDTRALVATDQDRPVFGQLSMGPSLAPSQDRNVFSQYGNELLTLHQDALESRESADTTIVDIYINTTKDHTVIKQEVCDNISEVNQKVSDDSVNRKDGNHTELDITTGSTESTTGNTENSKINFCDDVGVMQQSHSAMQNTEIVRNPNSDSASVVTNMYSSQNRSSVDYLGINVAPAECTPEIDTNASRRITNGENSDGGVVTLSEDQDKSPLMECEINEDNSNVKVVVVCKDEPPMDVGYLKGLYEDATDPSFL